MISASAFAVRVVVAPPVQAVVLAVFGTDLAAEACACAFIMGASFR
jgi:hypothetical protein